MGKLSSEELEKIKSLAEGYKADMTAFLRAIVANPGESSDEAAHVATIKAEMDSWEQARLSSHLTDISIQ